MNKENAIRLLSERNGIYGHMYGARVINGSPTDVIFIKSSELKLTDTALIHIWGFPGPDFSIYWYKDYGKTWGFSRRAIKSITIGEMKHE